MRPLFVVLNTRHAFATFAAYLESIPEYHYNMEDCIRGMYWHLDQQYQAHDKIDQYLEDLKHELAGQRPWVDVLHLCHHLELVARAIWEELDHWRVYDEMGNNAYYLKQLLGYDLVLELHSDFTYDPDDPNAPYQ